MLAKVTVFYNDGCKAALRACVPKLGIDQFNEDDVTNILSDIKTIDVDDTYAACLATIDDCILEGDGDIMDAKMEEVRKFSALVRWKLRALPRFKFTESSDEGNCVHFSSSFFLCRWNELVTSHRVDRLMSCRDLSNNLTGCIKMNPDKRARVSLY